MVTLVMVALIIALVSIVVGAIFVTGGFILLCMPTGNGR
jgi:hypothetical protein